MSRKIRVCLAGATGWVGRGLAPAIAESPDLELVAAVSRREAGRSLGEALGNPRLSVPVHGSVAEALEAPWDVLVDYTSPDAVRGNVLAAIERGAHAVVGTSGLTDEELAEIGEAARGRGVGVLAAGNFAITAVLLQRLAEIAAKHIPRWEVVEYGHEEKPDAPGGTARELAGRLGRIGPVARVEPLRRTRETPEARGATLHGTRIHSVRLPGFVSSIEVIFGLPEERLSIRHDSAGGSGPYVAGTLLAIRGVSSFVGLRRGLDTLMEL